MQAPREQGPAIGESLRILSIVTSFGVRLTGRSAADQEVRATDFIGLLRLVRLVGLRGKLRIPLVAKVLPRYLSVLRSWCFGSLARRRSGEMARESEINDPPSVRAVPVALPLEEFQELAPPPNERKELVVAWVGRFVAAKNVPLLIAIVEQALEAIPEIRFLIAGDGPERAAVESLVNRSAKRVERFDWQRDAPCVIGRADILLQTSLNEGTPTALIQGMAAARPFVSTAVGGVPDIVTGEERVEEKAAWFTNGVLVAPEAEAFVAVLRAFALDRSLLAKLGSTGRQWALANYAEPKRPDATHQLYSEYLAGEGRDQSPPLPPRMAREFAMTQQLTRLAERADFISSPPPHPDCATDTSSPPYSTDATAGQFAAIPPAAALPAGHTPGAPRCESQNRRAGGHSDARARTSKKSARSKRPRRAPG